MWMNAASMSRNFNNHLILNPNKIVTKSLYFCFVPFVVILFPKAWTLLVSDQQSIC